MLLVVALLCGTVAWGDTPGLTTSGGILNTLYGAGNWTAVSPDSLWWQTVSPAGATAIAKYASYSQNFGYMDSSNNFVSIFSYNGSSFGYIPPSSLNATFDTDHNPFIFADRIPNINQTWTSLTNSDGVDHMRTFLVTNGAAVGHYVLGWEDLIGGGDKDYDDFVIEVSGVKPVPEPATLLLLGAGAAGLCYMRRRQKKAVA
jgi:hypothetical protein